MFLSIISRMLFRGKVLKVVIGKAQMLQIHTSLESLPKFS